MRTRIRLPYGHAIKRFMPRTLLGRTLLIMLVPLVVVQAVALQLFYGSHLSLVSRRLSAAIAGEIAYTMELTRQFPESKDRDWILEMARRQFMLGIRLERGAVLKTRKWTNILGPMDDDLAQALQQKFNVPFTMDWTSSPTTVMIRLQLPDGVLDVEAPRKRLATGTVFLFVGWVVGSALLLFVIAALFMRNQVRAIRRLARSAEAFGMGRDVPPIRPEGAAEVRQAAVAFNRMQERIRRFLAQRTEMLAGVSHDLRTPLTRLRLALAMLPRTDELSADVAEMTADVEEMDRMIGGYLAFARGEATEQAQQVDLKTILDDVAAGARRTGTVLNLDVPADLNLKLRADAIKRAITNLVDNARRHATHVALAAAAQGRSVLVTVDDDGPGIPADRRESVFRPFESGLSGGTGLGLTIARDIIRAHGGEIVLEDSPLGGLRARIRLPI
ncbi:MAG: two-component sensor histidine kinase [Rhodospirillales bacterium 20-64-7]|nr:MAG: two-component sensor histidine kinase [Rhodospirillales bacterium 20-64-7]HQT79124.1 ATP-binding protein [Rhodopila sp.]